MKKIIVMFASAFAPFVSNGAEPLKNELTVVPPKIEELKNPSVRTISPKVMVKDIIMVPELSCSAGNTDKCSHERHLQAPQGQQACRILFSMQPGNGDHGAYFYPEQWYTNDPETPDRFNGYYFKAWAQGGGVFGGGANVKVTNIGLRVIPSSANNSDRFEAGCDMPPH